MRLLVRLCILCLVCRDEMDMVLVDLVAVGSDVGSDETCLSRSDGSVVVRLKALATIVYGGTARSECGKDAKPLEDSREEKRCEPLIAVSAVSVDVEVRVQR